MIYKVPSNSHYSMILWHASILRNFRNASGRAILLITLLLLNGHFWWNPSRSYWRENNILIERLQVKFLKILGNEMYMTSAFHMYPICKRDLFLFCFILIKKREKLFSDTMKKHILFGSCFSVWLCPSAGTIKNSLLLSVCIFLLSLSLMLPSCLMIHFRF